MRRILQILLVAAIALPAWAATARMAQRSPASPASRMCRARPTRLLSLCTSATDTIVALGAGDRLAAIDQYSRIVPGAERTPTVGRGSAVSRERVAALGIDLAFVWWYQDDAAAALEGLGVPVVRIRAGRADDVPDMIRLVGNRIGRPREAEASAARVRAFLDKKRGAGNDGRTTGKALARGPWRVANESNPQSQAPSAAEPQPNPADRSRRAFKMRAKRAKVSTQDSSPSSDSQSLIPNPRPTVFIELYGPLKTVGHDTYIHDLLELAGMRNIAADAAGSVQFSAERLVEADPDIILCVGTAADAARLAQRPGLAGLRAVRAGRVTAVDRRWLIAGPNIEQAVEQWRRAIP